MQLYTYIQKLRHPDGSLSYFAHRCEVLRFIGTTSVQIRIVGSFYNGMVNAKPTVRIKSVKGLHKPININTQNIRLPYKDE